MPPAAKPFALFHRPGRGLPWLPLEFCDTPAEAEHWLARAAAAGEYLAGPTVPRPDTDVPAGRVVEKKVKEKVKGRSKRDDPPPCLSYVHRSGHQ